MWRNVGYDARFESKREAAVVETTPTASALKCGPTTNEGKKWYLPVKIFGKTLDFLVDTGSEVSLIPMEMFRVLSKQEIARAEVNLVNASGELMSTVGQAKVPMQIGNRNLEVNIIINKAGDKIPPIIGMDTLDMLGPWALHSQGHLKVGKKVCN